MAADNNEAEERFLDNFSKGGAWRFDILSPEGEKRIRAVVVRPVDEVDRVGDEDRELFRSYEFGSGGTEALEKMLFFLRPFTLFKPGDFLTGDDVAKRLRKRFANLVTDLQLDLYPSQPRQWYYVVMNDYDKKNLLIKAGIIRFHFSTSEVLPAAFALLEIAEGDRE